MTVALYQADAFTERPFAGNPAAVVLLPRPASPAWMQSVASEMNLSETAFLVRTAEGHDLRWFTPTVEVDLCGHATLASAHVLWQAGLLSPVERARFSTRSGLLTCSLQGEWIEMDFPAEPPEAAQPPTGLLPALGLDRGLYVGRTRFDYLVEAEDETQVRRLRPEMGALAALGGRGVMVTARSSGEFDFVSRFFAPAAGIPEDPVTGSAHCSLGPYWAEKLGRSQMVAYQASARGGVVRVRTAGPRVVLGGRAVTVLQGTLTAAADPPEPSSAS